MANISRRQFLQSAGGVTFLALTPIARSLFAATDNNNAKWPLFTALPYVQPGANSKLIENAETFVIAWQTEAKAADFRCEYGTTERYGQSAPIEQTKVWAGNEEKDGRIHYSAHPTKLKLGTRYYYRVWCNGEELFAGYLTTRQPRGTRIRFATFGDNSYGGDADRAIAFRTYEQHPDFVMNTGDNVYDGGRNGEYEDHWFPIYNNDKASPETGAPLLRSVPFYTVLANHDVRDQKPGGGPCANFDRERDYLAYYTAMHLPMNGPQPPFPTTCIGDEGRIQDFKRAAGARYPKMANYSYDYGDAHFLCMDSNVYVDPSDEGMIQWIENDLKSTDAIWKFVTFHHPAYNVGNAHFKEQHMRVLSPLFEKHNVDFVLHGHEHNYQRTKPFRFASGDESKVHKINSSDRLIPGQFTIDNAFDGAKNNKPQGIIYLTTGAGGAHLYDTEFTNDPSKWLHPQDDNAPYVAQVFADRHSLTIFEIAGKTLDMKQVDENGKIIDRLRVKKA